MARRASAAWWAIGLTAAIVLALLAAGFLGWLGPLVPCGVDRVAECIAWSGAASALAWAAFILFFVGLAVWQLREWRREPIPPDR